MVRYIFFILCLISVTSFPQQDRQDWKLIEKNQTQKYWYDISGIDSLKKEQFQIWILQEYNPPMVFDEIKGEIHRSKTLYAVNLNSVKYGISKVIYYDKDNNEIASFNYNNSKLSEGVKYSFPITEDSPVFYFIKEYFLKK